MQAGAAIGMLLGRDCSKPLRELRISIVVDDDPVHQLWRRAIASTRTLEDEESPTLRAATIEEVDRAAIGLGFTIGYPIRLRPHGPRLSRLPEPRFRSTNPISERVTAGSVYAGAPDGFAIVDSIGKVRTVNQAHRARIPRALDGTLPEGAIVGAVDGDHGVWIFWLGREEEFAYEVLGTRDGGRSWRTRLVSEGGRVTKYWHDLSTGEIVLHVVHGDTAQAHRLTARQPIARIEKSTRYPGLSSCVRDGRVWGLNDDTVNVVTGGEAMRLHGNAAGASLDCGGDAAIVLRHEPDVIERCRTFCTPVFSPPSTRRGVVGVLDDGRWIYGVELEGVVGVWTEKERAPRFWRTTSHGTLGSIAVIGGRPSLRFYLLGGGTRLVPLQ